jgi:hypothetical protein
MSIFVVLYPICGHICVCNFMCFRLVHVLIGVPKIGRAPGGRPDMGTWHRGSAHASQIYPELREVVGSNPTVSNLFPSFDVSRTLKISR